MKRLIRDVVRRVPELSHVKPSRVLVVAGEARRSSRATIRPACEESPAAPGRGGRHRPIIRVRGRKILYVITLRPRWFLASTPEDRVATVIHELYHASDAFDGSLHPERIHERLPRRHYDRRIRSLCDRYLSRAPDEVLTPFSHHGVARARMWLERPAGAFRAGERGGRRVYTERQLFMGLMPMVGGARRRAAVSRRRRGEE